MSRNSFIAAIVVIAIMPIFYLITSGWEKEPVFTFRGAPVQMVEPHQGVVIVPNEVENQNAVPMRATLKTSFVEKVSGLKPPFADDLVLSIDSIVGKLDACLEDGSAPEQARFALAAKCAPKAFEISKLDGKTILEVNATEQFIMFGATSNNQMKLFHKKLVATYVSKDMTQGDRKREACIVRIMLDHLLGQPANLEVSCQVAPQG